MKKRFIIYNWVFLGILVYFICLPLITPIMVKIMPDLWICPYQKYTGKECPFCGVTTDLYRLFRNPQMLGNIKNFKNPVSLIALVLGLLEFQYRIIILITVQKIKRIKGIFITDIIIHILLISMFFSLAIYFWDK
ncbi:DUF2752 domain-containing protein [Vallitalea guaymasensis]|uniref:DUF2752 domain-containing protein n=1 Tax=Vallitalea guaymasensis TaxID=1185412 RepID=UPI00272D6127|nr:DUF2752 domain-containing protein [Vallitalea guaymasensis]